MLNLFFIDYLLFECFSLLLVWLSVCLGLIGLCFDWCLNVRLVLFPALIRCFVAKFSCCCFSSLWVDFGVLVILMFAVVFVLGYWFELFCFSLGLVVLDGLWLCICYVCVY